MASLLALRCNEKGNPEVGPTFAEVKAVALQIVQTKSRFPKPDYSASADSIPGRPKGTNGPRPGKEDSTDKKV